MLTVQFLLIGLLGLGYWRLLYLVHRDIKHIKTTLQDIKRAISMRS